MSSRCNQFLFALFYVVFKSSYWGIEAIFNAGESFPPSFLDTYSLSISSMGCKALCIVLYFLILWSICLNSSFFHLRMVPSILQGVQPRYLSLWCDFCYIVWFWIVFSFSYGTVEVLNSVFTAALRFFPQNLSGSKFTEVAWTQRYPCQFLTHFVLDFFNSSWNLLFIKFFSWFLGIFPAMIDITFIFMVYLFF